MQRLWPAGWLHPSGVAPDMQACTVHCALCKMDVDEGSFWLGVDTCGASTCIARPRQGLENHFSDHSFLQKHKQAGHEASYVNIGVLTKVMSFTRGTNTRLIRCNNGGSLSRIYIYAIDKSIDINICYKHYYMPCCLFPSLTSMLL